MKIKTLTASNFRSISSLTFECGRGINVIAGINGAGKTSVLSALEIAISWAKARIRQKNGQGQYPEAADIKLGTQSSSIRVSTFPPEEISWEISRSLPTFRGTRPKSDLTCLTEYADRKAEDYAANHGQTNLPMFVKYSVNRSLIDIPAHVHKKHLLDAMSLYSGRLDGGSNLRSFFEWFREREDIEREEREERKSFEYQDLQLKAVRKAISTVLPEYGELKTRRKSPIGFELRKKNQVLRVEQLSDGEKCYLTLVGDIARRLTICNPKLTNPLEGEGIVLIDELELHLHPKWQGESIDRLRMVFPNCQFFITTHSAHIVQNLRLNDEDKLLVLVDGMPFNVGASYGQPIEDLLLEVFGLQSLRPEPVRKALEQTWELLNKGISGSDELTKSLETLKKLVGEQDPAFAKINLQIALNRK